MQPLEWVNYVDTSTGTIGDVQTTSYHGGGKTYPGAARPSGMVQLSPDTITGGDNGSGYSYHHQTIEGFRFNHLSGIGWYGDLGNLQVMPTTGPLSFFSGSNEFVSAPDSENGWKSAFRHESEVTRAGYYAVDLDTYGIRVELTATVRTGLLRITFPESETSRIQIDLARRIGGRSTRQSVKVIGRDTLEGFIECRPEGGGFGHGRGNVTYTLYFHGRFSRPFDSCGLWNNGADRGQQSSLDGESLGFYANYRTGRQEAILFKAGISYVSIAGARSNLEQELDHWNFDDVAAQSQQAWESALDGIRIQGGSPVQKQIFYTCLYHSLLDPRIHADWDGKYIGADQQVHQSSRFIPRTIFSGWDVYRSEFPLLTLINPDLVNDEVNTLIEFAQANGNLFPRWELMMNETGCMVGDPAVIVISDAYVKGIRDYDARQAYACCRASAFGELAGRPERVAFQKLGYVPGSISETLEYTFADWCLGNFAAALGLVDDSRFFYQKALSYRLIFDPAAGWMRCRDQDGNWMDWQGKYDESGCVESNVFQQTWFVPHDVDGLIRLMGPERFLSELECLFQEADLSAMWNTAYNHSNEPCHHVAHLFNYAGQPWRTQYWTRRIQNEAYRTGPYGYCGNDDVGQISAWYVLTALGIHSTAPGSTVFNLNTPLFQRAQIRLNKRYHSCSVAETLTVETDRDPATHIYIKGVLLNGEPLNRCWIDYRELTAGGRLTFMLADQPDHQWGTDNPPPSLSG